MTGYDMKAAAHSSVCNRYSGFGRYSDGRGNTRYLVKGNIVFLKRHNLLAAAAKYKGVSSLKPYYGFAFICLINNQLRYFLLLHIMAAAALSSVNLFT